MPSPYEHSLGAILDELHPRLRTYFGEIPRGSVGVGTGVFTTVGTPRRWLWPVLAAFARAGILFPVWESDVAFTVTNRAIADARGNIAVAAERVFHLAGGDRTMRDAITAERKGLVDHLGPARRVLAGLTAEVIDGALVLTSTSLALRLDRSRIRIPKALAPVVRLVERFDDASGRQHVSVEVTAPLVGRLYEYSGSFTYTLEERP